jgi:predicted AAA+ superfamily ATPase
MIPRLVQLPKNDSFFLFGARATGKRTLLRNSFQVSEKSYFNLLDSRTEQMFLRHPEILESIALEIPFFAKRHRKYRN